MSEKDGDKGVQPARKKKHHGHPPHGGAWKVAFADFMTSMFALFLVLWIISSTSASQKQAIAQYFRSPTIFRAGSASPLDMGGSSQQSKSESQGEVEGQGKRDAEKEKMAALDSALAADSLLKSLGSQFKTKLTEQGLEIEISDAQGLGTFELGSARINPKMVDPILHLARALSGLPNKMVVAGHTDAYAYSGEGYSNWQLSADRANAVRDNLINDGIGKESFSAVVGYGETELAKPEEPFAAENRRVTLLVLTDG